MSGLVAQPWWANAILLAPLLAYFSWCRAGVPLAARELVISGLFAASFGFLEATVVVYLRAAAGLLPGYRGTLSDVVRLSGEFYHQLQALSEFPQSLLTLEVLREAATIFMLLSVAFRIQSDLLCKYYNREPKSRPFFVPGPSRGEAAFWVKRPKTRGLSLLAGKVHERQ